jgi:hypothetical protein
MSTLNLTPQPQAYQPPAINRYMPTQGRARVVVLLLIVNAVVSLLSAAVSALGLFFPVSETEEITDPVVLAVGLLEIGVGLLQIVVYIATVVVFLMWLYRAYENLPSFGIPRSDIKYSSGWAVGSFFIPFVSLVVPYRAVKELWNKSVPHAHRMFGDLSVPGFFPLWWAVWLISNFANQAHLRLEFRESITPETSYIFGIVTGLIDILSALLAIMVVREIENQQTESSKLISQQQMDPQPPAPPVFEPPLTFEQA